MNPSDGKSIPSTAPQKITALALKIREPFGSIDPAEYQHCDVPEMDSEPEADSGLDEEALEDSLEQEPIGHKLRNRNVPTLITNAVQYEEGADGTYLFPINGLPKEMVKSVASMLSTISDDREKASAAVAKFSCIKNIEEFKEKFPLCEPSDDLTAEELEEVHQKWLEDPNREELLDTSGNTRMVTVYKICLRLWKCVPEDIISRDYDLVYDQESNNRPKKNGERSLIWSSTFCENLCALICHEIWQYRPELLALATHYVIKIDTDNRLPWHAGGAFARLDPFIMAMAQEFETAPARTSIVDIRKAAVKNNIAGPTQCWLNWLFEGIEKIVEKQHRRNPPTQTSSTYKLRVNNDHLEILIKAVNNLSGPAGIPLFRNVGFAKAAIVGARWVGDFPRNADMRELRHHVLLRERQINVVREKEDAEREEAHRKSLHSSSVMVLSSVDVDEGFDVGSDDLQGDDLNE